MKIYSSNLNQINRVIDMITFCSCNIRSHQKDAANIPERELTLILLYYRDMINSCYGKLFLLLDGKDDPHQNHGE